MNKINFREEERHGTPYFPFQAFSQKDTCGQYFAPYHWHDEVEFLYVTEGSLLPQKPIPSAGKPAMYTLSIGTVHGIFGDSPIPTTALCSSGIFKLARYDICQMNFYPVLFPQAAVSSGRQTSCLLHICSQDNIWRKPLLLPGTRTFSLSSFICPIALLQILETLFSYEAFLAKSPAAYEQEDFVRYSLKPVFSYRGLPQVENHSGAAFSSLTYE